MLADHHSVIGGVRQTVSDPGIVIGSVCYWIYFIFGKIVYPVYHARFLSVKVKTKGKCFLLDVLLR